MSYGIVLASLPNVAVSHLFERKRVWYAPHERLRWETRTNEVPGSYQTSKGEYIMLAEKKMLNLEEIEAQMALELPDREMLALVTVVITDFLDVGDITIQNININAAVQLCAQVIAVDSDVSCTIDGVEQNN